MRILDQMLAERMGARDNEERLRIMAKQFPFLLAFTEGAIPMLEAMLCSPLGLEYLDFADAEVDIGKLFINLRDYRFNDGK